MTNKLTRIFAFMMVSLALLTAPVISGDYDTPFTVTAQAAKKKAPAISAKKKTVYYKGTATLKLKNYKGKVKWTTSNKKVAKVNSKGVVTGVALGKCTITATAGKKKYKCTVTVKDRNVTAATSFKVNGGGYFIKDESTTTVTVKPKKYNAAKATVTIENAAGDTVYKKTLKKLAKNKKYTFVWNGKNTKGKYVSTGSYRVKVKIGTKVSYSAYLTFNAVNDFADGNGTSSNPFIVQNVNHLRKLVKYPTAYFRQANDIDFNYSSIPSLFSVDQPFNGTYDGAGKAIKNISATAALFDTVGEKGTIKNVKMVNCSVVGDYASLLVKNNYGKITDCNINGMVSASGSKANESWPTWRVGLCVANNYGIIANSVFSGSASTAYSSGGVRNALYTGGIVFANEDSGRIINCKSSTNVTGTSYYFENCRIGGIAAVNYGLINSCEANGNIEHNYNVRNRRDIRVGSLVGVNYSQMVICSYTGTGAGEYDLIGTNEGTLA